MARSKKSKIIATTLSTCMVLSLSSGIFANAATPTQAIDAIVGYASDDNASALTIQLLKDAGAIRTIDGNLDEYKVVVANAPGDGVDTTGEIQLLVDIVNINVAIDVIEGYASGNNASALTIQKLTNAGVTTAIEVNLSEYKTKIASLNATDVNTTAKIQKIVSDINIANSASAIVKIKTYATGTVGGANAMTIDELLATGITNTIATNLEYYRDAIEVLTPTAVDTVAEIQTIINSANTKASADAAAAQEAARIAAVNTIKTYAANDDASLLTINLLKATGVSTDAAKDANLTEYKKSIADATAMQVDTTTEIVALINEVNTRIATSEAEKVAAIEAIADFAANDNASELTLNLLVKAGVINTISVNLGVHNADITKSTGYVGAIEAATLSGADTTAEIQVIINTVNTTAKNTAITAIMGYANGDNANSLTIAQLLSANVNIETAKVENIADYKTAIVAKDGVDLDTPEEIQALVDLVNQSVKDNAAAKAAAIEKIRLYAANDNAAALTIVELTTAGVINTNVANLVAYKTAIASATSSEADTTAKIQTIINNANTNQALLNAINVIKGYAGDATAMTIQQLKDAGVTGTNDSYLAYYKVSIAALTADKIDTTAEIQAVISSVNAREAVVSIISEYAGNDDASALTTDQLKAAGAVGVLEVNFAQYKVKISDATLAATSTTSGIQTIINTVNQAAINATILVIKGYAKAKDASALTVEQLNFIGLSNIIVSNLGRYKSGVAAATEAGADTKAEIQGIIDAANTAAVNSIINTISGFAGNDNADNLTTDMLLSAGITNVVAQNLTRYKTAIVNAISNTADSQAEIQALINNANTEAVTAAISVIGGYATLDDASALTIDKLAEAGVKTDATLSGNVAAISANLSAYKLKIALLNASDIDTTVKLQAVITEVNTDIYLQNAINIIVGYANNNDASALTKVQLDNISIANYVVANLGLYKSAIAGKTGTAVDTKVEIQAVIDATNTLANAINKVAAFAGNANALEILDLTVIGITGVLTQNLTAYRATITAKASADVDTITEIQKVVNDTNTAEKANAINIIKGYAANDNAGGLTLDMLTVAGVIGGTGSNLDLYKTAISNSVPDSVDSTSEIQTIVSEINRSEAIKTIKAYAGNDDASLLTIPQLQTAGVTGTIDEYIAAYRVAIAKATTNDVDSSTKLQTIINSVNDQLNAEKVAKSIAAINGVTIGSIQGSIPVGSKDKAYLPVLTINVPSESAITNSTFAVEGQGVLSLYANNDFTGIVSETGVVVSSSSTLYAKVVSNDTTNTSYYKVVFNMVDPSVERYGIQGSEFIAVGSNFEATVTINRDSATFINDPKLLLIYTLSDGQTQVYITQNASEGDNQIVVGAGVMKVDVVLVDGRVDWTDPQSPHIKSLFTSLNFPNE
ncbi:MAG: hypothetical protein A2Y17_00610 [Clostridiales bacterium GWF2_38_85]|nr:MAG: hypothetical protein A2Y17_00610 [Clostridiales bacterium GWF2_38_85]